ncbi:MAG: hypothetical protein ACLGG0_14850 [Bacteriovoracia bacterium]
MKMILRNLLIELGLKILDGVWLFLRPIFYLYLVWIGLKLLSLFQ